jgi:Phosphotransferase enzyme family
MQAPEVPRAVAAAMSTASALDLTVDDAKVLCNSNKLALRLLPCDVFARVAHVGHEVAQLEVELALRLAETDGPVAALEPRVEPRVYERDGFAVTLWTYYESLAPQEVSPADYAKTLTRLHVGMRKLDVTTPHFTDRVAEAQQLVASRDRTPALADADRELLSNTLRSLRRAIGDRGAAEQLLHGEPYPGNVLSTKNGLRFIDLETCCRGPVEFDLAHVPEEVSDRYPYADQELLRECRILVLAMVAAWRWDPGDQLPNGQRAARELLSALARVHRGRRSTSCGADSMIRRLPPMCRSGARHNTHTERRISRSGLERRSAHMRSRRYRHGTPVTRTDCVSMALLLCAVMFVVNTKLAEAVASDLRVVSKVAGDRWSCVPSADREAAETLDALLQ